jgi:hypothetical protein
MRVVCLEEDGLCAWPLRVDKKSERRRNRRQCIYVSWFCLKKKIGKGEAERDFERGE